MKKLTLKEISSTDSLALTAMIDYWKDYDLLTVLLAYGELNRRGFTLDARIAKRISEFCSANNTTNIEILLSAELKTIGHNSYPEYYEKEIGSTLKFEEQKKIENKNSTLPERKYPALRTISGIYKVFGWLIAIATLIIAIILGQTYQILPIIITLIVGAIFALGVFAAAEAIIVFIDIEHNTRQPKK